MVTALLFTSLLSILGSSNSKAVKGSLYQPPITLTQYPQIGSCEYIKDDLVAFKKEPIWDQIYYNFKCLNGKTYYALCAKKFVKFVEVFKSQYVKVKDHIIMLYKYFTKSFKNLYDATQTIKFDEKINGACFQTYQKIFPDDDNFGKVILYIMCACSSKYWT
ncbi:unnamed protein product [Albugo candida]|uniref:Uncharacterized protein n=1 Tax=Albugo candida TaxID=65357 RepID=A0A024GL78_9STRA|nr:unnamed protein product [Albugo candida]|eukprot:CCI47459.1 unnamed protein product [Albugo candida]